MNIRKYLVAGLLLAISCASIAGETYKYFPGAPLDERTLRAQERVEELYERGEYQRALLIYEYDLAPKGDKYAQYTIGYMHLTGRGVPKNRATALAWYRLAAERGEPQLSEARDTLFRQMSADEIAESNATFVDLWQSMGDNRLILNLIRDDLTTLKERTGSRIPGGPTGQMTAINVRGGAERYYQVIEDRIKTRVGYLQGNVEIIDIDLDDKEAVADVLENSMRQELAALELP